MLTRTGKRITAPGLKEEAIVEIGSIFHGEIIFSEELMVVDLDADTALR